MLCSNTVILIKNFENNHNSELTYDEERDKINQFLEHYRGFKRMKRVFKIFKNVTFNI